MYTNKKLQNIDDAVETLLKTVRTLAPSVWISTINRNSNGFACCWLCATESYNCCTLRTYLSICCSSITAVQWRCGDNRRDNKKWRREEKSEIVFCKLISFGAICRRHTHTHLISRQTLFDCFVVTPRPSRIISLQIIWIDGTVLQS